MVMMLARPFRAVVSITTGPAYVATGTDNDTVNIERVSGTSDNIQFAQMLRVSLGAGDRFQLGFDIGLLGILGESCAYGLSEGILENGQQSAGVLLDGTAEFLDLCI